jgi:signal transduction histidine kinase
MTEARAAVSKRLPMTDLLQLRLPPEPTAATEAALLIADACTAWSLPGLQHPARAIVTQLVNNAVEHAGTNMLVTISRRGRGLHLSVRDGDPRLPRLLNPNSRTGGDTDNERGHGLQAVNAHAVAWGAMPTRVGKVVWATVHHRGISPH